MPINKTSKQVKKRPPSRNKADIASKRVIESRLGNIEHPSMAPSSLTKNDLKSMKRIEKLFSDIQVIVQEPLSNSEGHTDEQHLTEVLPANGGNHTGEQHATEALPSNGSKHVDEQYFTEVLPSSNGGNHTDEQHLTEEILPSNGSKHIDEQYFTEEILPSSDSKQADERLPKTSELVQINVEYARVISEMEALRARIMDLETQLHENEQRASKAKRSEAQSSTPAAPILYEKEEVGFTYVDDQILPIQPSKTSLTTTDQVIKSPLTAGGQTIGEMRIAQPEQRNLTPEDVNLANAVAQQVSTQIQNLRLLAAAERARAEAQDATRQFTHKNWETFLDAIHKDERIGYVYDQAAVEPSTAPAPAEHDYQETVQVLDEQIGRLFVKADENRPITEEDKALINTIAKQIGQQVENIRLLADAARARAEAEEATRRLTRQNWEAYTQEQEGEVLGFVYDSIKVSPLGEDPIPQNITFEQPLVVRGESIGQLSIAGMQNVTQEGRDLAAAIASQASVHLETLRLTEELQKRARELQELDRLKSAFLANMSHELRTPLNSILGFADVMLEGLDGPLTENMDNDLKLIQKNGQHLLHLINDVLDMAKIESGKMNLIIEKFNLHEIMEEVTSITAPLASEKNIALFIEPDSDMAVNVNADRTRLRQVLINVINNAIKFTENGKIAIHASRHDDHVLVTVKDTGIGIPPDHLENIFIEFTQVDSSTTRKVGGTGLGLPISRRLIEMHGGRLWAESSGIEGEGSTFFIDLPIEAKAVESEPVTKK